MEPLDRPLVRVIDAHLGPEAQVRLVVTGVSKPDKLRSAWSSAGASLERVGDRLRATTTVQALVRAAGRSLDAEEARALDRTVHEAVAAWLGVAPHWEVRGGRLATTTRPLVMGIVNVTPDSFADGGRRYPDNHPDASIAHGRALLAGGADLLDVGGESTRPGAAEVGEDEEMARVLPVVEGLARAGAIVSIDTRKAAVAAAAIKAGARIVNDVSGAASDDLLDVASRAGAGYVLMHTRGTPADMQEHADYQDVVAEVFEFLAAGLERCTAAGIARERTVVDVGIGFAKTLTHNLDLLRGLRQFRSLGRPVLLGASRKSFLGEPLGGGDVGERLPGSLAVAALAAGPGGAAVLRVHDAGPTVAAARAARAVTTGQTDWPPPVVR